MSSSKKRHIESTYSRERDQNSASYKRSRPTTICDEDGHIVIKLGENLTSRYKVIDRLGEGTFGKVLCCWDREKREYVAIKVIRNVKKYRDAAQIEIDVLERLRRHDPDRKQCLIRLRSSFNYYGHYCLVFRQYGLSVYDFMKKNYYRPFTTDVVQSVSRQLLQATAFMHDLTLIHTDLKPENLLFADSSYEEKPLPAGSKLKRGELIPKSSAIKVIDLGSATYDSAHHTTVVSTRHYRAPEVILNLGWTYPCDIWSIGCIIVELYTGEALFQTHHDLEHLAIMQRVLGKIPPSMARRADSNTAGYFYRDYNLRWPEMADSYDSERYVRNCQTLEDIFRKEDSELLDLVTKLLTYDPSERISARDALAHPFFSIDYAERSKLSTKTGSSATAATVAPEASVEEGLVTKQSETREDKENSTVKERVPAADLLVSKVHNALDGNGTIVSASVVQVDVVEDGAPASTVPKLSEPLRDRSQLREA